MIIWIIGINLLLKFWLIWFTANPSDVAFYAATGWILNEGLLPYQLFEINNPNPPIIIELVQSHPNGPFNYLFYGLIYYLLGDSIPAIKLPMLIGEIIVAVYLFQIGCLFFSKERSFWMALIYSCFIPCYYPALIVGCDEIITSAFVMMGFYYFLTHRPVISGFWMSLGISYKFYPVFLVIPFLFYAQKNGRVKEFIIFLLILLITYFAVSFPYLLLIPDTFMKYNFGQVNRLVTISYGYYIQDSWFYRSFFTLSFLGFAFTPHLIFEISMVGGFMLWDLIQCQKKKKYSIRELCIACFYYIAIIPIISLSYNYRYFQWVLPFALLCLFPTISSKYFTAITRKNDSPFVLLSKMNFEKKIIIFLFLNLILNLIVFIVHFIQQRSPIPIALIFGTSFFNEYLWTFTLVYGIFLGFVLLFFYDEKQLLGLCLFGYLQGMVGILIYLAFESRLNGGEYHYFYVWCSIIVLIISLIQFYVSLHYTNANSKISQNTEVKA